MKNNLTEIEQKLLNELEEGGIEMIQKNHFIWAYLDGKRNGLKQEGDEKQERVFTESEVKKIAMKAIEEVRRGHVIGITNVGLASGSIARAFDAAGIILGRT